MSDDNNTQDSGGGQEETVDSLKAKLAEKESAITELTAEATKHKNLRRKAETERDELKKKVKPSSDDSSDDYKTLWQETNDKLNKSLERAKKADINAALTEQLGKAKVAGDRIGAAMKLVDTKLIEWSEDSGIDGQSVVAAVQKLQSDHGFLFETTVAPTDPKKPGDAGQRNTISRKNFDALSPLEKVAKVKDKVQIVD